MPTNNPNELNSTEIILDKLIKEDSILCNMKETATKKKIKTQKKASLRMCVSGTLHAIDSVKWVDISKEVISPDKPDEIWMEEETYKAVLSGEITNGYGPYLYDIFQKKFVYGNGFSPAHLVCGEEMSTIGYTYLKFFLDGQAPDFGVKSKNPNIPPNIRYCCHSGHLSDISCMIEVNKENGKAFVHKCFNSSIKICGITQKPFHQTSVISVTSSANYAYVSKYHAIKTGLVKKCYHCGQWFESSFIVEHNGNDTCKKCLSKIKAKNAIAPYNDKHIPPAIFAPRYRYGFKIGKDGLIYATQRQQPIPAEEETLWGVELEVELNKKICVGDSLTRYDLASLTKDLLGSDFVSVKEDGSLTMNGKYSGDSEFDPEGKKDGPNYAGFEIVSCPASMEVHAKKWSALEDAQFKNAEGRPYLLAWDTDTCGMHVHRSKANLGTLQIARIVYFVNHRNNQQFIFKVAGRSSAKYCRYFHKEVSEGADPKKVISPEEHKEYDRNRRVAVNICPKHTIEFRIFRGTFNYRHVMRNLQFCDAVVSFCQPCTRSVKELEDYKMFIRYVNSHKKKWPLLAEWMAKNDIIKLKKPGPKADVSKLTLRPELVTE